MRKYLWLLVAAAVVTTGCDRSKPKLEAALAEQQQISAEKDSLMAEILETSKFVADVNTELAKVKGLEQDSNATDLGAPGAARDRAQRQATLARIQTAIASLNENQAKLTEIQKKLSTSSRRNSRLAKQVSEYKQQLADLQTSLQQQHDELTAVIEQQKTEIASLGARVDTLTTTSVALKDTVTQLTTVKNTAYYVVGTKDELRQKGIVVQEGSKFLFFGGHHLEPSRNPDPAMFTRIDLTADTVIALPDSNAHYTIVSRQSPTFVDSTAVKDGKVQGELRIADPAQFWAPSKFLILVRD
ncbi:MAG TPA: hypothetical protein VFL95_11380 [Gemmatimonadales bacterium]|nr:hypothetical protein [Gemmatimonadales bacterium]